MAIYYSAACATDCGRRIGNQDRVYFQVTEYESEKCLSDLMKSSGTAQSIICSVFDGIGGENHGDIASMCAFNSFKSAVQGSNSLFSRKYILEVVDSVNRAVTKTADELKTDKIGSTFVSLWFQNDYVYMCNVGDSRAYRLRDNEFLQLSVDHVILCSNLHDRKKMKFPLSQYLGVKEDDYLIEPYVAKGELRAGDQYLLCSDGLSDAVSNIEIASIMASSESAEDCVSRLIHTALERGGKDNISVIICRIQNRY